MGGRTQDVWVFRIVHPETGKPVQGVPVTVLDATGNPAGYWVSAADGTVAIPRRDVRKLRLRVGLRSEDQIEPATATLGDDPTPLAAPVQLPPAAAAAEGAAPARDPVSGGAPAGASGPAGPPSRPGDQPEVPGHVLYFQRLAMFGEGAAEPADVSGAARGAAADFFALPGEGPAEMRYGVLIEVEQYWQSLGVLWGELLYSVTLTPGDEARLVVLDGRWRRETDGRERPLRAHEPGAAAPAARGGGRPGRRARHGRGAHGAQHDARSARDVPLFRAPRALQGRGAHAPGPARDLRAVPAPAGGDRRRGAA